MKCVVNRNRDESLLQGDDQVQDVVVCSHVQLRLQAGQGVRARPASLVWLPCRQARQVTLGQGVTTENLKVEGG
jgi:hypothetical protein